MQCDSRATRRRWRRDGDVDVVALLESGVGQVRRASVDTAVCARLLPRTSTSLPLRHLGPGPASVIRDSPASRRFRILNARRKMPGRPSDARDASLSLSQHKYTHTHTLFSSYLLLSSRPDRPLDALIDISHRAKYMRIFTRIVRHKYHSSAIPIGVQSIAIDLFVGL